MMKVLYIKTHSQVQFVFSRRFYSRGLLFIATFLNLNFFFFTFSVTTGIAYGTTTNDAFYYSLHKRQMNAFAI